MIAEDEFAVGKITSNVAPLTDLSDPNASVMTEAFDALVL